MHTAPLCQDPSGLGLLRMMHYIYICPQSHDDKGGQSGPDSIAEKTLRQCAFSPRHGVVIVLEHYFLEASTHMIVFNFNQCNVEDLVIQLFRSLIGSVV